MLVLGLVVSSHDESEDDGETEVSTADGVSLGVLGLVGGRVDEGRDDTTGVTDRDDDSCSDTLFEGTTTVVGSPRNDDGNERVDTGSSKEKTGEIDTVLLVGDEHDETNQTQRGETDDDYSSLLNSVRPVSSTDGGEGSENVRRDRHQLSGGGCVTQVGGEGGREEGEAVDRHKGTLKHDGGLESVFCSNQGGGNDLQPRFSSQRKRP